MVITNGTFDTDLGGWTYTSAVTWQSPGKARIYAYAHNCPSDSMQQTFTITAPTISFDYVGTPTAYGIVTIGWDFIVADNTIISSEILAETGTRTLDVSSHIGKSATIRFKLIPYCSGIGPNDNVSLIIDNVTNTGGIPILFTSTPIGATIIINGIEIPPKTNVQINYPIGTYSYILRLPCHEDINGQLNVVDGPPISINGSFIKNTGDLSIISQPPGADVYYGSILQGQTPLNYTCYPEGVYNYYISFLGYQPFIGSITVVRNLLSEVNAPLVLYGSSGLGSIYVVSNPQGATIFLDDNNIGQTAPYVIINIPIGSHTIRLEKNGYNPLTSSPITVEDNKTSSITMSLTVSPANIIATVITQDSITIPCTVDSCAANVSVTWTNTGGTSGTFIPNITIDTVAIYPAPFPSESLDAGANILHTFIISGLAVGPHTICPFPN
jgi:hypothetical protein